MPGQTTGLVAARVELAKVIFVAGLAAISARNQRCCFNRELSNSGAHRYLSLVDSSNVTRMSQSTGARNRTQDTIVCTKKEIYALHVIDVSSGFQCRFQRVSGEHVLGVVQNCACVFVGQPHIYGA
jgi:hypothetical protein